MKYSLNKIGEIIQIKSIVFTKWCRENKFIYQRKISFASYLLLVYLLLNEKTKKNIY